ncbi:hypothetical protein HPB51_021709 [Rhipicephalus microplus]|uniref:Uncharacterized protein n=1 Tax=Rhipicephalus microplus TaxID=6941 RepID=A0A9J6D7Z8_RHIMP|nr:hypothetical protein HPB51_021709 [Rhipicephalus microplus]
MAQPFNKPVCDDQRDETILRSRRTLQRPAATAPVAMASDLATAGSEGCALPAGVLAKPQGDSSDLAPQTVSLPRGAVHAPMEFASGTIPGATSVPSPEDRRISSPVAANELCTGSAVHRYFETASTVTFSAVCARTTLPPQSMAEILDFTGIDQDPTVWRDKIHSLASRHVLNCRRNAITSRKPTARVRQSVASIQ